MDTNFFESSNSNTIYIYKEIKSNLSEIYTTLKKNSKARMVMVTGSLRHGITTTHRKELKYI